MKMIYPLAVFLLTVAPLTAGNPFDKDPALLAKDAKTTAEGLLKEVKSIEERVAKGTQKETDALKKYSEATRDEAEHLLKASEAWSKNQKRLAEKYFEKAQTYCHKRGELSAKIPKPDDEHGTCEPEKPKQASKDSMKELEKQISQLGEPTKPTKE